MKRTVTAILAILAATLLPGARYAQAQEDAWQRTRMAATPGTSITRLNNQGFVRMFDGDRGDIGEFDVFTHAGLNNTLPT